MPELSCDILHYIFSSLPAECLLRLRAVCKTWKHVIDNPFFVKSHTKSQHSHTCSILVRDSNGGGLFSLSLDRLNYASNFQQVFDVTSLKQLIHRGVPRLGALPVPSCNGLILLSHHDIKKSWVIWNPLVQSFHELPPPATDPHTDYGTLARCGFGYHEAADDYKVVRVDILYRNRKANDYYYRSLVYSLRSRRWRAIEGFPGGDCFGSRGAFLNGALHWRARDGIIALDLGEGHRHRLLPRPPPSIGRISTSLEALDGCLILSYGHQNLRGMDAWVMKDYGTWTKLFSFQSNMRGLRVVAYLKTKGQVFLRHREDGRALLWLDLNHKSAKTVTIYGAAPTPLTFAQFYPGSLLRLDNAKTRRGVKRNYGPHATFTDTTLNYL